MRAFRRMRSRLKIDEAPYEFGERRLCPEQPHQLLVRFIVSCDVYRFRLVLKLARPGRVGCELLSNSGPSFPQHDPFSEVGRGECRVTSKHAALSRDSREEPSMI